MFNSRASGSQPPPPPPPGAPPGGSNGFPRRQSVSQKVRDIASSAELIFAAGQIPVSDTNRLIFTNHSIKGGLPSDPSLWGFYSVLDHFEKGLTLDKKALPKFHAEYEELVKRRDEESNRALSLRAILDHSKLEYGSRFYRTKLVLEKSLLVLLPKLPENAEKVDDIELSRTKTSRRAAELDKAVAFEPQVVTPRVADELELFEPSTIWPDNLVFTDRDSVTRSFATRVANCLRSRLAGYLDTQNTRVDFNGNRSKVAAKLNELCRRYLARRGAFYESTGFFYRGLRNYLNTSDNSVPDLPEESSLDDDTLRELGITYYLADKEVDKATHRLATDVLSRPVVTVPAIRVLKRAIDSAFEAESNRSKTIVREKLQSAFRDIGSEGTRKVVETTENVVEQDVGNGIEVDGENEKVADAEKVLSTSNLDPTHPRGMDIDF